jgi:hypothetical protein
METTDQPPESPLEVQQDDITRKILHLIETGESHLDHLSCREQLRLRAQQLRKSAALMDGAASLIDRLTRHLAEASRVYCGADKGEIAAPQPVSATWSPADGNLGPASKADDFKI